MNSGTIKVGQTLTGGNIALGTTIVSQTSGTTGGAGVYVVSVSQTLVSTVLSGATLFALAAQANYQNKANGVNGNVVQITANLNISNAQAIITFPVSQVALAQAMVVAHVALLQPPILSQTNSYFTGDTDDGAQNIIYCIRDSDYQWGFPSHSLVKLVGTCQLGTNTTSITSTDIGSTFLADIVVPGKYIIQFLSGVLEGYCRLVSASTANTLTWVDAFNTGPSVGDIFQVIKSNYSLMNLLNSLTYGGFTPITSATTITSSQNNTEFLVSVPGLVNYNITLPAPFAGMRYKFYAGGINSSANIVNLVYTGTLYLPDGSRTASGTFTDVNLADPGNAFELWSDGTNLYMSRMAGTEIVNATATLPNQPVPLAQANTLFAAKSGSALVDFNTLGLTAAAPIVSNVVTGTAPFTIASTTPVANLSIGGTAANATSLGGVASTSYALLAGPTFTGVPAAPTATPGTNTTQLATTAFVAAAVGGVSGLLPEIITGTASNTGVITRNHTGNVLIEFSGFAFTGGNNTLSWAFYVNGGVVNARSNVVNYQVSINPTFNYILNAAGNFTVQIVLYGDSGQYNSQITLTYF